MRVGCRCLLVLAFDTERISKVVEGLRFFGVDRDRPLVVSNRLVYFLDKVKSVPKVVVHVAQVFVKGEGLAVVSDSFFRTASVVVSVTETDVRLELFFVVFEGLVMVLDCLFCVA